MRTCKHLHSHTWPVIVNNSLAIFKQDFDSSGEPGPQAKEIKHLKSPLRQLHVSHRASSCAERGGDVHLCSKPRGCTRNRTQDLPKKGSVVMLSSSVRTCIHMHMWNLHVKLAIDGPYTQSNRDCLEFLPVHMYCECKVYGPCHIVAGPSELWLGKTLRLGLYP